MKLGLFLPVLAVGAMASASDQLRNHALLGRAIDPKTMDPVRYSVLSVLHTAMPTGAALVLPTGSVEPDWYKNLPQDVKSLLPSLYPLTTKAAVAYATPTSTVASASASASPKVSSSTCSNATFSTSAASVTPKPYVNSTTTSVNYAVPTSRPANGTLPTGASLSNPPVPLRTASAATKTVLGMEKLTALLWLGVGAAFIISA